MATSTRTKNAVPPVNLGEILTAPTLTFTTEPNSPFSDGYSIKGEEEALAPFIKLGAPEGDPLFDRYVELQERKENLQQLQDERTARRGADVVVTPGEARSVDELGRLVDESVDQMTIHTIDAHRMFQGRAPSPGEKVSRIIGGKRIAAALRNLWLLTGNDNPYADWALLRHEHSVAEVQKQLASEIETAEDMLNKMRTRGLSLSVLTSDQPSKLNLGFKSPYGYAVSMLIVQYDYFVRVQRTLQRKNLLTDQQTRTAMQAMSRSILRVFNDTARFERWLTQAEVGVLSRADWVSADPEAGKRVEFATKVFGPIPASVFTAELVPSHSRRRYGISEAEQAVLNTVAASLEAAEQAASAVGENE